NQPSGPLFGVQFSQLTCSDFARRVTDGPLAPQRSPLGLSADSGGLPLYKNGETVGGVGVIADATYGLDFNIRDRDQDIDELIAGQAFGTPASGIRLDTSGAFDAAKPPNVLVDALNNLRFPVRAGSSVGGGQDLTAQEVFLILRDAYQLSLQTRGQIRIPLGTA